MPPIVAFVLKMAISLMLACGCVVQVRDFYANYQTMREGNAFDRSGLIYNAAFATICGLVAIRVFLSALSSFQELMWVMERERESGSQRRRSKRDRDSATSRPGCGMLLLMGTAALLIGAAVGYFTIGSRMVSDLPLGR